MARLFDDGSSQYLEYAGAVLSGVPITMACRFKSDDTDNTQALVSISNSSSRAFFLLSANGGVAGDPLRAVTDDGVSGPAAETTTGYSANTWHHACAVFAAANDRRVFIDGGSKGTNTTSKSPSGLNVTDIGCFYWGASKLNYMSGSVDEVVIYDVALTDNEVGRLYLGDPPWEIRPGHLRGLWLPFGDRSDRDFSGRGYHMTAYNSPIWTADPPQVVRHWRRNPQYIGRRLVSRESPGRLWVMPFGKPVGLSVPVAMHHYRKLRIRSG